MDVTAGADSGSSGDDVGAADNLASHETENYSGDNDPGQDSESAPAGVNPPQTDYVTVPGFGRVHKDDAPKAREFVKGSYNAFQQANLTQKQFEQLQADPESFLERMGVDLDTMAGRRLAKKLEAQLQTPEQRQKSEQERAFAEREAKLSAREKQSDEKALAEDTQREIQTIDTEWSKALEDSGLPKTREHLREMAKIARDYLTKGIDAPADHIAELVKENRQKNEQWHQKRIFDESTEEEFAQYMQNLGPKAVERVRQFLLNQVKHPTSQTQSRTNQSRTSDSRRAANAPKRMTESEFRKWMNQ